MRITKEFKVSAVCAPDETDSYRSYIFFADGWAYASDGHALVKVPIDYCFIGYPADKEELNKGLNGISIHMDAYNELRKLADFQYDRETQTFYWQPRPYKKVQWSLMPATSLAYDQLTEELKAQINRGELLRYPDFQKTLDSVLALDPKPVAAIGLNAYKLQDIMLAIGAAAVRLEIHGEDKAAVVKDNSAVENKAIALIMPVRLDS